MNKKRVLATAMSALMIVSSTPVAAIAEVANQPFAAGAVAAGLNPGANGGQELNAALGDTANGDSLPGGVARGRLLRRLRSKRMTSSPTDSRSLRVAATLQRST